MVHKKQYFFFKYVRVKLVDLTTHTEQIYMVQIRYHDILKQAYVC